MKADYFCSSHVEPPRQQKNGPWMVQQCLGMILWSLPRSLDAPETKKKLLGESRCEIEREGVVSGDKERKRKKGRKKKEKNWKGGKYLFL
jgi:hypothetical protein